ncbi:MAG TPA: CAP domain-containing protein [Actinoplanes sp.]|nr:CAP domain-containing protein [Actinoplanes sp.]
MPTQEVTESVSMSAARFRSTLVAGATAIVIGAGFTLVGLNRHSDATSSLRSVDAPLSTDSAQNDPGLLDDPAPASSGTAVPTATPSSPAPTTAKPRATTKAPVKPKPRKTTRPPSAPASKDAPATGDAIIDAVLSHINDARARAGLAAYTLSTSLSKASALHNQLMIDGCGLSHQCPGEGGIGERFSAQGVQWTAAGENIGFGSSGSSDAAIIQAANGLTDSMLAEKPPNDGHRKNLLSSSFKRIGLNVVRDSSGKTWMTQDFVN